MEQPQQKTVKLKIHGMHCASCEVLIERKFRAIAGVQSVRVSHATGKAVLSCSREPDLQQLDAALKPHGYSVTPWGEPAPSAAAGREPTTRRDYLQAGAIFLMLFGLYLLLRQYGFLMPNFSFSESMGYGVVFLIGLVAAMSTCLAVTGGLLLAVAAKYNEQHPHLTGAQRFRPHLYFNAGRVVGYTGFGAGVGAVGSMLTISPRATGVLTVAASIVMIVLGLQLLKIFPWMSRLQPKMPRFLAHKIHDLSGTGHPAGPATLGALTFFLPCGFTQALQLYVLTTGSWVTGALTMLVFALGTLPALVSLGIISSFARGGFQRYFLKFSGALVILFGLYSINNGLTLAGIPLRIFGLRPTFSAQAALPELDDPNVTLDGQRQIVRMDVLAFKYQPSHFTIRQNVPVRWEINGVNTYGCQSVILMPKLGITKYIQQGPNVVEFTPTEAGELQFHCSMGMYRGSFTVVPNEVSAGAPPSRPAALAAAAVDVDCDPTVSNCQPAQQLKMEISRARGFYPRSFTVKRGVPVELAIDTQLPLGGCMGVMVIPEYNLAHRLTLGQSVVRFTPTRTGTFPFTCSMGSPMGQIAVVN